MWKGLERNLEVDLLIPDCKPAWQTWGTHGRGRPSEQVASPRKHRAPLSPWGFGRWAGDSWLQCVVSRALSAPWDCRLAEQQWSHLGQAGRVPLSLTLVMHADLGALCLRASREPPSGRFRAASQLCCRASCHMF